MKLGRRTVVRASAPVALVAATMVCCVGSCVGFPCMPTGVRYGMWLDQCPATDLRLSVTASAQSVVRGRTQGQVRLTPMAQWLSDDGPWADTQHQTMRRGIDVQWTLRRGEDEIVEGLVMDGPELSGGDWVWEPTFPQVPDGDYTLVGTVTAPFEEAVVEVPLALYAPSLIHVASDRPLYKPGQTVELRAAVLRRTDHTPLEGRPGRWRITAPDGTEMHVEKAKGGPWGVSATSFPLSDAAEVGQWTATYQTGDDVMAYPFRVQPFQLPRLRVEAEGAQRWFHIGETAAVKGRVVYASGAPVRNAALTVRLQVAEGRWPMPLAWEEPIEARTAIDGSFEVEVGEVPSDLMERAVIAASVQAVDETGEVVRGGTRLVLAVDDIAVDAVSELGDGLVENANNRVYVRVRTPDGRALASHDIVVSNPFDPSAPTFDATTDADGVAAIQLDPGAPITVIEPAPPARPRPLTPDEPTLTSATEMRRQRVLDLAERRAIDRVARGIAACGVETVGSRDVQLALRVAPSGAVTEAVHEDSRLARCVARVAQGLRFPAGEARLYQLTWRVPDSLQPSLAWSTRMAFGAQPDIVRSLEDAAAEARRCFPRGQGQRGAEVVALHWSAVEGSAALRSDVVLSSGTGLPASARPCIESALRQVRLQEPAKGDAAGVSIASLSVPQAPGTRVPQPVARPGFELAVAAAVDDLPVGTSRLQIGVGAVPPLRLRATPSLAAPGERVTVKMFRGPDYRGELPEELHLMQGSVEVAKAKRTDNEVEFELPMDADGFYEVAYSGGRAVIFVSPANPLKVAMSTDKAVYRPGEEATLTVRTTAGESGIAAAVMLAGVDESLSQLTPLMGPDAFGDVTVRVTSDRPAFDAFDARMLSLGQIRGANAAQAAVLRVGQLPSDFAGDESTSGSGQVSAPVEEAQSVAFYAVMDALVAEVRAWEASAPDGEVMKPPKMVTLWEKARATTGAAARDGYGRPLTLDRLPDDLLAQVDPRAVVVNGTRLPEDVTPWIPYVRSEVGR